MPSDTERKAVDRAERFAKSPHATCEDHDDIMVAVRLARRALTPTASEATAIGAGDAFFVSLALSKPGAGCVTYSMSQSWRMGGTEQEAIDAAILFAAKEKPGFGVWEKLVSRVPLSVAASPKVASDTAPGVVAIRALKQIVAGNPTIETPEDQCSWTAAIAANALAASPTASDTDTAIPGGEARAIISEMIRLADMGFEDSLREPEENGNYAVYERAKRYLAASPKPDTDTPVDPGVEGVREAIAVVLDGLSTSRDPDVCVGPRGMLIDALFDALAAKPIAGLTPPESA